MKSGDTQGALAALQQSQGSVAGAPLPPDDDQTGKNKSNKYNDSDKKLDRILDGSDKVSNRNSLSQYNRNIANRTSDKAWRQAQNDFNNLNLKDVRTINTQYGQGRTGTLPDGRMVTVRPSSSNGSPTLQINSNLSNKFIKIRY